MLAAGPPIDGAPTLAPWAGLLLGVLLVLLNGFFVAAEFALVKLRPTQLEPKREPGRAAPARAHARRTSTPTSRRRSSASRWRASRSAGSASRPSPGCCGRCSPALGAGEALVHSIAADRPPSSSSRSCTSSSASRRRRRSPSASRSRPRCGSRCRCTASTASTYPVIWLLNSAANGFLAAVRRRAGREGELGHSEEELRLLLASTERGRSSQQKRELLDNVFELSHRVARQIMVPRGDVVYLSTTKGVEENLRVARTSRPHPLPALRGRPRPGDRPDPHQGPLPPRAARPTSLEEIARPLTFVPETLTLDQLLRRMRARARPPRRGARRVRRLVRHRDAGERHRGDRRPDPGRVRPRAARARAAGARPLPGRRPHAGRGPRGRVEDRVLRARRGHHRRRRALRARAAARASATSSRWGRCACASSTPSSTASRASSWR